MFSRESPSTVSANINVTSKQSEASFSIAESNTQVQPAAGGALASAFDEEFVSVPNVQFASLSAGPNASTASAASVTAVPEMSALFPIVGLIAAVSCTQILRRRRMAQKDCSDCLRLVSCLFELMRPSSQRRRPLRFSRPGCCGRIFPGRFATCKRRTNPAREGSRLNSIA